VSKAFVKDDGDGSDSDLDLEDSAPKIPAGTKNYITPGGAKKLREELSHLLHVERPKMTETVAWAASNGDRSENADYIYGKRRLREIDRRLRFLTKRLEIAEIVDPTTIKSEIVRFGATVTVRDPEGVEKTYSIVGVDEIDLKKGHISWLSPLGAALLRSKAKVGDEVTFIAPKGEIDLEIVSLQFIPIS
jgi:transcription elongation factor GreB